MQKKILIIFFSVLTILTTDCKFKRKIVSSDIPKKEVSPDTEYFKSTFHDALKYKMLGEEEKALNLLSKCINMNQNSASARYEAAKIAYKQNDLSLARKYAEEAIKINDKNKWYKFFLADIYMKTGEMKKAAEIFSALIEQEPKNQDCYFSLADLYISNNETDKAIETLNLIEQRSRRTERTILKKAYIYMKKEKEEKAEEELKSLLIKRPKSIKYIDLIARFYSDYGKYDKAIANYKKIAEMNPEDISVHENLYFCYYKNKEYDKASEQVKLIFGSPAFPLEKKIYILEQNIDIAQKQPDIISQNTELTEILLKKYAENNRLRYIYFKFLYMKGRKEEAHSQLKVIIDKEPKEFQKWEEYLDLCFALQRYEEVKETARKALEFFPNKYKLYFMSGKAALEQKNYGETLEYMEMAKDMIINEGKDKQEVLKILAEVYYKQKEYEKAYKAYNEILEITPNNVVILNDYSYCLAERNEELNKALEMSAKCLENNDKSPVFLDTHAYILSKLNKTEKALKYIKKAAKISDMKDNKIMRHYAEILEQAGQNEQAKEIRKKIKN